MDGSLPQILQMQSMKREISDLRSRVTILEQEKIEQEVASRMRSCNISTSNGSGRIGQESGKCETCVVQNVENSTEEYIDTCNFCRPRRCRACDERISMIPPIISLLVKHNLIDARELGTLSSVSHLLHRFICVDSDDEIWSYLLHSGWPSTTMIPPNILNGLSNRAWVERIVSSELPGQVNIVENPELLTKTLMKRKELRDRLDEGDFYPLPDPSLGRYDVMMLVDIFQDNKPFLSAAEQIDASKDAYIQNKGLLCIQKVTTFGPTELEVSDDGCFCFPQDSFTSGRINLVRLTDYKIICVSEFGSPKSSFYVDDSITSDKLNKTDIRPRGNFHFYPTGAVGTLPTLFNARLGDDGDFWFQGFSFSLSFVEMVTPHSPYHCGYEDTVARYRDYMRNNANERLEFGEYSHRIWENAVMKPELARFFVEAREMGSKDGKYYGNFRPKQKWPCRVFVKLVNSSESICFGFTDYFENHDDAFLNLLQDLFEPKIDDDDDNLSIVATNITWI